MDEVTNNGAKYKKPNRRLIYIIVGVCLILIVAIVVAVVVGIVNDSSGGVAEAVTGGPTPTQPPTSAWGRYRYASVAADDAVCSTVGTEVLAEGGSAVDSAIAALLCNGVRNAHSMGIGGGFFMTIYDKQSGRAETLLSRERAPIASTYDMYTKDGTSSTLGGLASGTPGEVRGYWEAHRKYGKLPWRRLFEPAIKLCQDGSQMSRALARAIKRYEDLIRNDEELRSVFTDRETGEVLQEGDVYTMPTFANTLEIIADKGVDAFYDGELSDDIVADLKDRDGIITREDLRQYNSSWKSPVHTQVSGDYDLYTPTAPSSGVVLAYIINILDGFNLQNLDLNKKEDEVLFYHRVAEAFKHAYAKRSALGDSDFVDVTELVANMTDSSFGEYIRSLIHDHRTYDTDYYKPSFEIVEDAGTAHISVLAGNGDAVAVTSTINLLFGSKVMGKRTGVIFNNEMDDFSTPNTTNYFGVPASPSNFIEPFKMPMSSMSPTILVDRDKNVRLVVGASGGTKITTSSALVAMRTMWMGESIQEAISARRPHHQLMPTELQLETGFDQEVEGGLLEIGHNVTHFTGGSVVQGIRVEDDGYIYGCSDFRKGGAPDGF